MMHDETSETNPAEWIISDEEDQTRLDLFLVPLLSPLSRSTIRKAIDAGRITVDGLPRKPSYLVTTGARVSVASIEVPSERPAPENIALEIIHEDDAMVVVNKQAGMVVHQGKGHSGGTLAAALVYHFDQLSSTGGAIRPGIVHRLDRDTTGVIVIAKNNVVHEHLAAQFKARTTEKEYFAIIQGVPDRDRDRVNKPIGPHPHIREKMAIREGEGSREAETFFEVIERFDRHACLKVLPKTGRTHQIRIHLASIGFPILCDRMYGGVSEIRLAELLGNPREQGQGSSASEIILARQALHARRLELNHPLSNKRVEFIAPLPKDLEAVLNLLRTGKA